MKKYWLLFCCVILFLGSASAILWNLKARYQEQRDAYPGTYLWPAAQVHHELWRFLDVLSRYSYGDRGVDQQDLHIRYDILWAQASNFKAGVIGHKLDEDIESRGAIDQLMGVLSSIENDVKTIESGNHEAAEMIRLQVEALAVPIFAMTQQLDQTENNFLVGLLNDTEHALNTFSVFFIALTITGFGSIFLLFNERKKSFTLLRRSQQAEQEIAGINASLEETVAERTKALQAAHDQLADKAMDLDLANKSKTKFFASMSHEVRTPLNGILGLSNTLQQEVSDPQVLAQLQLINNSAEALLSLLNNILDLAQFNLGKMELRRKPDPSRQVIANGIAVARAACQAKGLSFVYDIASDVPTDLMIDRVCVDRIVINLLSNACKFTDQGQVGLAMTWEQDAAPKKGVLAIRIYDSGPGLPKEKQDLFASNHLSHSTRLSSSSGSGLGLQLGPVNTYDVIFQLLMRRK